MRIIAIIIASCLIPNAADAYLDPGVGSIFLQAIIGSITFLYFFFHQIKQLPTKLLWLFSGKKQLSKSLNFTSKADTLVTLKTTISSAAIPTFYVFNYSDWQIDKAKVLHNIKKNITEAEYLIIRSSSMSEDLMTTSNAGVYESVTFIPSFDTTKISAAIERVFSSYTSIHNDQQVLVQKMITNFKLIGVVNTASLEKMNLYHTITYDDETNDPGSITSGLSPREKLIKLHCDHKPTDKANWIKAIHSLITELHQVCGQEGLDIEFAIDQEDAIQLLQVRPRVDPPSTYLHTIEDLNKAISLGSDELRKSYQDANNPPIYSNMTDWNPAEIIGTHPKPLDIELYKTIITDSTWAKQRKAAGYKHVAKPLLISFSGHPYIDVEASLSSFIPNSLSEETTAQLLSYYMNKVRSCTHLHDKVEFEVVLSNWHFNINNELKKISSDSLSQDQIHEIYSGLLNITQKCLHNTSQIKKNLEAFDQFIKNELRSHPKPLSQLGQIRDNGGLPFANAARSAFVAESLLQSLIKKQVLTSSDYALIISQSANISKQFSNLGLEHGGLRAGMYDICSKAVPQDRIERLSNTEPPNTTPFSWSPKQLQFIDNNLPAELSTNPTDLLQFITTSIYAREYGKYLLSSAVNTLLNDITKTLSSNSLSPEEIAYLHIKEIEELYSSINTEFEIQKRQQVIEERKREYTLQKYISLPTVIVDPLSYYFYIEEAIYPTFITTKRIEGETLLIDKTFDDVDAVQNKIILVEQADPGFDWLFLSGIRALVTAYGGQNSHLAIRANEFQVPTVIGVGPTQFNKLKGFQRITINCDTKSIRNYGPS